MPYTAAVVNHPEQLIALLDDMPTDWVVKCHHMTCDLKPINKSIARDFAEQTHTIKVVRLGKASGIWAVEVESVVPSVNAIKHITLCHDANTKPKESNNITDWCDITAFEISATVTQC